MVSEKTVIILITIAIILSIISIAVTISTVNTKMIPKVSNTVIPDEKSGQVSLVITQPSGAPATK